MGWHESAKRQHSLGSLWQARLALVLLFLTQSFRRHDRLLSGYRSKVKTCESTVISNITCEGMYKKLLDEPCSLVYHFWSNLREEVLKLPEPTEQNLTQRGGVVSVQIIEDHRRSRSF